MHNNFYVNLHRVLRNYLGKYSVPGPSLQIVSTNGEDREPEDSNRVLLSSFTPSNGLGPPGGHNCIRILCYPFESTQ